MPEAATRPPTDPALPGVRERNKRDKLERIVRAAGELFRAQGFDATTGRQICEHAGIGTGTLFLYVRDKRELLYLIFRPMAERTFARLPRGLTSETSVVDGLMTLFGAFYRLYGRDSALARLFLRELFFRSDPSGDMQMLTAELRGRIAQIVEDGRQRGELQGDLEAEVLGAAVTAHYVFWLQLWLGTEAIGRRAAESGLRRALELQLSGIGTDPAGRDTGKRPTANKKGRP